MPFSNSDSFTATDANNLLRGLHRNNANSAHTGDTNETDLSTFTMTGGTMTATGAIVIRAAGTVSGAAGTKQLRLYLGSTAIQAFSAVTGTEDWSFLTSVSNTAASAQRITSYNVAPNSTAVAFDYTTSAVDTSANQTIKVTGQLGNAADTITQTVFEIFVVQIS